MATIEPKYKCNLCDTLYDDDMEAVACWRECNEEDADVAEVYLCPVCKLEHCDAPDALDCCGYDPDAPPPPPTAEELESAGQARLPI